MLVSKVDLFSSNFLCDKVLVVL